MGGHGRPSAGDVTLERAAWRNVLILAAGMGALYGMVELVFGVAALTFEEVGGSDRLAGLAPAIFLLSAGASAAPAGRLMDRRGRRPVLAAGFAAGFAGCLLAALGASADSLAAALVGFVLTGVATGIVLLSRAAAADMFEPERRPRAIALVLFGAVFGALLGPLVFAPLLSENEGGAGLDLAWLGGAGFMAVGLVAAVRLHPDPREIGRRLAAASGASPEAGAGASASLREIVSRRGVAPPLLAVLASLAGMVAAMSLTASALIDHGHEHDAVFPVLAAHFVGMFAFFPLVGRVIGRLGRVRAIASGLVLLAASGIGLAGAIESVHVSGLMLLGVGLGWNVSFVAATAELSERAGEGERATLIGFSDLLGNVTGASLVVAGGFALDAVGVGTIAVVAAALPLAAALWITRAPAPAPAT